MFQGVFEENAKCVSKKFQKKISNVFQFCFCTGFIAATQAGGGGSYDDVDEEINVSKASFLVSEANIFVSEASKLSEILVLYICGL